MGVGQSVNPSPVFASIQNWPWTRVHAVIKAYNDEELDFGIDHSVVSHLTGLTTAESKSLIAQLSKSDSGIVNAITMLITLAALGEAGHLMLESRLETIFELMDFDGTAQITMDEMTILLLCVASSFSSVLSKPEQCPSDMTMSKLTLAIYNDLNKKPSRPMLKSEFLSWTTQCLANVTPINIDSVFDAVFVKAASVKAALKQSETVEVPKALAKSESAVSEAKRSPRPAAVEEVKPSPRPAPKEEKPTSAREVKASPRPPAAEEKIVSARSEAKPSPRPEPAPEKVASARSEEKPVSVKEATPRSEIVAEPEQEQKVASARSEAKPSPRPEASEKVASARSEEKPPSVKEASPRPEPAAEHAEVKEETNAIEHDTAEEKGAGEEQPEPEIKEEPAPAEDNKDDAVEKSEARADEEAAPAQD